MNKAQLESILWKTGVEEGGGDIIKDGVEDAWEQSQYSTEFLVQELNHKSPACSRTSIETLGCGSLQRSETERKHQV